jgi:hypothetical protein
MPTPSRRAFLRGVLAAGGAVGLGAGRRLLAADGVPPPAVPADTVPGGDRAFWLRTLDRVSRPVLTRLAADQLRACMPVEAPAGGADARRPFSHLEAFGRTVAGLAPWLEAFGGPGAEAAPTAELVLRGIERATNPRAADFMNFGHGGQALVDTAFLSYGLLLAPTALWQPLAGDVKARVGDALRSTRALAPPNNNWLLFSAMVEACLARFGDEWRPEPIDRAVRSLESWYKGDGIYGDGPEFHWDHYNSFVIQPFLATILETMRPIDPRWQGYEGRARERALRYAAVQERMVAPDGSFPPIGRSLAYRCGAFHHLAHQALLGRLPPGLGAGQARCALTAVIRRTLGAQGTFDGAGWLRVGLCGAQPSLAEAYISTGSLYLCLLAFHPLGLPREHAFWNDPDAEWTQQRAWSGGDLPADHALREA